MQVVTLVLIPGGIGFAIWRAYRANARAQSADERFDPRGKIRWEAGGELVARKDR